MRIEPFNSFDFLSLRKISKLFAFLSLEFSNTASFKFETDFQLHSFIKGLVDYSFINHGSQSSCIYVSRLTHLGDNSIGNLFIDCTFTSLYNH